MHAHYVDAFFASKTVGQNYFSFFKYTGRKNFFKKPEPKSRKYTLHNSLYFIIVEAKLKTRIKRRLCNSNKPQKLILKKKKKILKKNHFKKNSWRRFVH